MQSPQQLLENLEKSLTEWKIFGRRAQLEAIMPIVESLTLRKVGCPVLAKLLEERGFEVKPDTLRQALHRWRKRQSASSTGEQNEQTITSAQPPPAPAASSGRSNRPADTDDALHKPKSPLSMELGMEAENTAPLTKARLKEIRDQHVDLDAIKRAGRRLSNAK